MEVCLCSAVRALHVLRVRDRGRHNHGRSHRIIERGCSVAVCDSIIRRVQLLEPILE